MPRNSARLELLRAPATDETARRANAFIYEAHVDVAFGQGGIVAVVVRHAGVRAHARDSGPADGTTKAFASARRAAIHRGPGDDALNRCASRSRSSSPGRSGHPSRGRAGTARGASAHASSAHRRPTRASATRRTSTGSGTTGRTSTGSGAAGRVAARGGPARRGSARCASASRGPAITAAARAGAAALTVPRATAAAWRASRRTARRRTARPTRSVSARVGSRSAALFEVRVLRASTAGAERQPYERNHEPCLGFTHLSLSTARSHYAPSTLACHSASGGSRQGAARRPTADRSFSLRTFQSSPARSVALLG